MTREEAIEILKNPNEMYQGTDGVVGYTFNPNRRNYEAFQLAIKLLEQKPCEDAVSRTEITDELNRLGRNAFKDDTDYDNFFAFLDSLPSVTPTKCIAKVNFSKEDMQELVNEKIKDIVVERKKGEWIKVTETEFGIGYKCSECGRFILTESVDGRKLKDYPYCHCGAEMQEVEE